LAKKIALIDGDVLCYLSFEPRWLNNVTPQGVAVTQLDPLSGRPMRIEKTYTKEEDAAYLKETWQRFQDKVLDIQEKLFCDEAMVAVQGPNNYRAKMYPEYKMSSGRTNKPNEYTKFLPILRKLAVQSGLAVPSTGCEADDLLRWWALEAAAVGQEVIIASNDKDLLCIPGKHYNIRKDEYITVTQEDADRLYFEQLIKGDPVDNIPGLPGVGPVKATKALANCKTVKEYQETVVGMYISTYGDDWRNWLLSNGKMIHIQRYENDWFDLHDWPVAQELDHDLRVQTVPAKANNGVQQKSNTIDFM